jgi:anti-sigma regulatory factor (Ser/Thr protein kinase)
VDVRAHTTLPPSVSTPATARAFARDAMKQAAGSTNPDVVALVVSELVTNAVVHGRGDVSVDVVVAADGVRVEVADADPLMSPARPGDGEAGRGLLLVSKVAQRWGVRREPAGKVVWASVS